MKALFAGMVVIGVLLLLGIRTCHELEKQAEAERQAAAQYAATHPPPAPVAPVATTEALVLRHECFTPCSAFVGWSYKVRTDGDPVRIKYKGCGWVERPGKGQFSAPTCFQPGEAEFESPDLAHPHVPVWVYEKRMVKK